ncbi:unnamed protein product, partial [Owenia fusiformis]
MPLSTKVHVPADIEIDDDSTNDSDNCMESTSGDFLSDYDDFNPTPIATQTENDIINEIKELCSGADKALFIKRLCDHQDVDGLVHSRDALFDYARINRSNAMPPGALIRRLPSRKNKQTSTSVKEKLACDIYHLFHFINGASNLSDIKTLLNPKAKTNRKSVVHNPIDDTMRHKNSDDQLAIILKNVLELKSNVATEINELKAEIAKSTKSKVKELNNVIEIKQNELNRCKDSEQKLKNDLKIAKAKINDQQTDINKLTTDINETKTKLLKQIQTIQNKVSALEKSSSRSVAITMNQEQLPSSNNDNVQDRSRSLSGPPNTSGSLNNTSAVPTSVWGIPLNPPTVPTGANKCSASSTKDISNVPATPITLSASSTCSAPTATCTSAVKTNSGAVTCSASDVSIECSASHTPTM